MSRFEAATNDELDDFVQNQKSLNTQRSTKATITLLEQYKVQAFGVTQAFDDIERSELVKIMKSFYQKVRRVNGDPYEPNSLRTMHYGVVRHFREEMQLEFTDSENNQIIKHLGAVNKSLRKIGMGNLPNKIFMSICFHNLLSYKICRVINASKHNIRT